MYELLQGLNYCHKHGVLHRNLKPDNIMITEDEHVVITDFSLSRIVNIPHTPYTPEVYFAENMYKDPKERERSGREARRLWYRAPELLFRKNMYTFEVDIWTLGCVLAELALNEPLFAGDSEIEQLFRVFHLLGVPADWNSVGNAGETKIEFPKWEPIHLSYAGMKHCSPEFIELCQILVPNRDAALEKLIRLEGILGPEGMHLLEMMLSIDPQRRATTHSILMHPFFNEFMSPFSPTPADKELACYSLEKAPVIRLEEMWKLLLKNEKLYRPKPGYMEKQKTVNETMRSILVDWLIDVSVHFELTHETMHLAVLYLDRVLSDLNIEKSKLQLLGVTCMKIADVFNERSKEYYRQENAKEYAYITAEEYTPKELLDNEKSVLMLLKFQLLSPTCIHFMRLYEAVLGIDESTKILSSVSSIIQSVYSICLISLC